MGPKGPKIGQKPGAGFITLYPLRSAQAYLEAAPQAQGVQQTPSRPATAQPTAAARKKTQEAFLGRPAAAALGGLPGAPEVPGARAPKPKNQYLL